MMRLIVEKGEPAGAVFEMNDGEHLLGRGHHCSERLMSDDVSREHGQITVQRSAAFLQNLSKFGTRVDDQLIEGRVELKEGQRIAMGKHTVLLVEVIDDAAVGAAGECTMGGVEDVVSGPGGDAGRYPTRAPVTSGDVGNTINNPMSADAREVPSGKATAHGTSIDDDAPPSQGTWSRNSQGPVSQGPGTRVIRTRGVTPEDLAEAKREVQRREKRRVALMAFVPLVLIVGVLVLRHALTPPPEPRLEWPVGADGSRLMGHAPAPNGGYDVVYPLTPGVDVPSNGANPYVVKCELGRKANVHLRVFLAEEQLEDKSITLDRDAILREWIERTAQSGDTWSFDKPLQKVLFMGDAIRENGIPTRLVTYQRMTETEKWFGAAYLLRHGQRLVTVRVELPVSERVRGEDLLYDYYIEPSVEFMRTYWEGTPQASPVSIPDVLRDARQELRRQAPGSWAKLCRQLGVVLQQATPAHDEPAVKEALELLVALRQQQAFWFNNQSLQIVSAKRDADKAKVKRLARDAQGVFTDSDDWRFYECRRW